MTRCFRLLLLAIFAAAAPAFAAPYKTTPKLILAAATAKPGDTVLAGLHLHMEPGWHTYWRNPGEIGQPTVVEWDLPAGVTAGELQWPPPEKYNFSGMTNFVYHDEVVLLVALKLAADLKPGPLELVAKLRWLECEVQCVQGRAEVDATLAIGSETKPSADAALLAEWQKKIPQPDAGLSARAWWEKPASGETRPAILQWAWSKPVKETEFFPYSNDKFEMLAAADSVPADAGKMRIRKFVKKSEGDWPAVIAGVLVLKSGGGEPVQSYEVNFSVALSGDAVAAAPGATSNAQPTQSLALMLLYAFLGGMILNIMPCVLPVIALKILGFVQQSKESPREVAKLGFIYALGVLASFLVLAGLVIAVKQAGKAAGWGMQFQNPQFVIVMTTLVTLVALNLFGLFEVTLGGSAMSAAGDLSAKEGAGGAFFNGILATVLATPCTAPFMGVALGFAFTQPPGIIIVMFLLMGAGLAAPYVVLSCVPQWMSLLPRPGAWMEKFKIAMGFPMLATALWLLSLTAPHFGNRGPLWVGLFLVVVAFAAWVWGEFVQRGTKRPALAMAIAAFLIFGGYAYALERELHWRSPQVAGAGADPLKHDADGIDWKKWTPAAVEEARKAGRPVLVDFTADWCVSCQANKKTSLEIASVRAKLKEMNAVSLLGDYTVEDPLITAELKKFSRAGVPLVLVYPKDASKPPEELPALLTPGIVLAALERASK